MNTPTLLQQQQQLVAHAHTHTVAQLHLHSIVLSKRTTRTRRRGEHSLTQIKMSPSANETSREREKYHRGGWRTHMLKHTRKERGEKESVMGSIGAAVAAASVPSASASEPKYLHKFFAVSELRQLKREQQQQQLGPLFFFQSTTFTDHDQQ